MGVTPPLPPKAAVNLLNAHLREIRRETEKELSKMLREVGNNARDVVRRSTEDPYRTGKTRKSVKTSVRRKNQVSLYSNLPAAPVWEFGGKIRPRGTPISIPKTSFVSGTVLALGDQIDEELADAFDSIARRNGFL